MKFHQKTLIALSIASLLSTASADTQKSFVQLDEAKNRINQTQASKIEEFHQYIDEYLNEYESWRTQYNQGLDKLRNELIGRWGSGDVSSQTTSVEYLNNNKVKKVIDHENNTATISLLLDNNAPLNGTRDIAQQHLTSVDGFQIDLAQASLSQENVNYSQEQEKKEKSFILKQVEMQMMALDIQADRVIQSNTGIPESFIFERTHKKKQALLTQAKARLTHIAQLYHRHRVAQGVSSSKDTFAQETPVLNQKKIVSYTVKLPSQSFTTRAEKYRPLALEESKKWGIDFSVIMAIMHSESSFRHDAKSHVPAFGLMQIVPYSAGRDVNRHIRNVDAPMKEEELYIPPVNVETGTAYLYILNDKYLKAITDPQSRLYCTIAAYNTGAGNVARAFNKDRSTSIKKAAIIINKMQPDEVYQHLLKQLPYDETKNYLKKVTSRIEIYKQDI